MRLTNRWKISVFLIASALSPAVSHAVDCNVPSAAYPTIQRAIDSSACTTVNLADQSYPESVLIWRSLTILGPAGLAAVEGLVEVRGAGSVVEMDNLSVENGCTPSAFLVSDGGQVNTERLEVEWTSGGPCPPVVSRAIFLDGFESGDTSAWSITVP